MTAEMLKEKTTESSSSDDDSVSLLRSFSACQSSEGPEDMKVTDFNSSAGKKEDLGQVKPPESVTSTGSSRCHNATAQLGNHFEKQTIVWEYLIRITFILKKKV